MRKKELTSMKRLYLVPLSACVVAALIVGVSGIATAAGGNAVICKLVRIHGKKRVECPKKGLRGKHGKRGPAGPAGPTGSQGPAGATGPSGAGSGLTLNFNAKLNAAQVKQLVIGNFTVRAAAQPSGACENIKLLTESLNSRVSVGPAGGFNSLPSNSSVDIQAGDTSQMFTAVTENGGSTVSGIVGRATVGGFCLVSGYVTGV
jgi:hypothetical protein